MIANTLYYLSERIYEEELLRKNLRSLPNKFLIKIVAIEKYSDISTIARNQVIIKLQTFETSLLKKKKGKKYCFQANMLNLESGADDADIEIKDM